MILFSYTDKQGILLGCGELWGSSFRGPGFPVGTSFPQILGIQLKVHSPAQDGVLLSRESLFCFLLHHLPCFVSLDTAWTPLDQIILETGIAIRAQTSFILFTCQHNKVCMYLQSKYTKYSFILGIRTVDNKKKLLFNSLRKH